MLEKIKNLIIKNKEVILYLIFGGLTTLLSIVTFFLFFNILQISTSTLPANIIANGAGILFAYFTNRKWVFESKTEGQEKLKEFIKFVVGRLATVALDLAIVFIAVDLLKGNSTLWKLIATVLIVILNYILSKLLIFVKTKK